MPNYVTLVVNGERVTLADPSGGTFNAAGDFDGLLIPIDGQLIPIDGQLSRFCAPEPPVLRRLGAYADVEFTTARDMEAIAHEAALLLPLQSPVLK